MNNSRRDTGSVSAVSPGNSPSSHPPGGLMDLLIAGLWFGIVCGFMEAVLQLGLQQWVDSRYVSVHILWVAPCLYGLGFALLGALAAVPGKLFPKQINALALLGFVLLTLLIPLAIVLQDIVAEYAVAVLAVGLSGVLWRWLLQRPECLRQVQHKSVGWMLVLAVAAAVIIPAAVHVRETMAVSDLPQGRPDTPNVLLVVIDTLRADHMSAQGYARKTTPNMDALAEKGVLFERAYATSPWSLPSHVSLLSGNTFDWHGIGWDNHLGMRSYPAPVLSELLRQHGYRTGTFSANSFWVTHDRLGRGFIHFDDYFYSVTDGLLRTMYGRIFERFVMRPLGYEDIPARRYAEDINNDFLEWVDEYPDRPYFALLNYFDVHDPYLPKEPYRTMYSQAAQSAGYINARVDRGDPEVDAAQLQAEIDAYDGGIFYVDEQMRVLVDQLEARGLADNTVLIITSDHGESFGEHDLLLHGNSLYHEQLHVPLIFVWPDRIPENLRLAQPVSNASIASTVLELCRIDNTLLEAEPSLAGWMSEASASAPVIAHVEQHVWVPERSPAYTGELSSILQDQWQLITHEIDPPMLFNLQDDLAQEHNLAEQPQTGSVQENLRQLLEPRKTYQGLSQQH